MSLYVTNIFEGNIRQEIEAIFSRQSQESPGSVVQHNITSISHIDPCLPI